MKNTLIAALLVIGANTFGQTKLTEAIRKAEQNFVEVFASSGGAGLKNLYSIKAVILPPNGPTVSGNEAIGQYWKGGFDAGVKKIALETTEVEGTDQLATEVGRYTLFGADGKEIDNGKYMVLWKKEDGNWKLYRDIWNSSVAPK